jgi:hypothetical protein
MAQQFSQPFTALHIGLAARRRFDVLGIDQDQGAPLLEHIEDGTPQHARTLHGYMRHFLQTQPVVQRQQVGGHGPKGAHQSMDGAIWVGQQHTGHDRLFVDVSASTARIQNMHTSWSDLGSQRAVRGIHQFRLRAHLERGATVSWTGTNRDQLPHRASSAKTPRSRLADSIRQYAPVCDMRPFSSASMSGTDIALPNFQGRHSRRSGHVPSAQQR